jgi:tRNA uridine 5-carboxymethylaminomethyl modification enzyme
VREIDALDGLMGRVTDAAGIHFKMLNVSKGPAVRGPRAQADRDLYKAEMQNIIFNYDNLTVLEASAEDLIMADPIDSKSKARVLGLKTGDGREIDAPVVVLTTGTFLRGRCHIGRTSFAAGRQLRGSDGIEPPSIGLALTLDRLGFALGRMKTGTPPRLLKSTIDWDKLAKQPSDMPPPAFSYLNHEKGVKLINSFIECAQTATNETTHRLVMQYKDELPSYDGAEGDGVGPRYCPSLFKKVQRFPDR